jgi:2-hydroxychromene-2-carboxylate isomerase
MQTADWNFDFISPFSYLSWQALPRYRDRLAIRPVPVLLGAILGATGNRGPAEIPGKRRFTYRMVLWQAERAGVALRFPPTHPFNPLPALRLALALDARDEVIDAIFTAIWRDGLALDTPIALAPLAARFGVTDVEAAIAAAPVKAALKANTEAALARGVFGVPTLAIGDELFWGNDALPLLDDWLADPARFARAPYDAVDAIPASVSRGPTPG